MADERYDIYPREITVNKFNVKGKLVEARKYVRPLEESSINRILDHAKEEGIIIISANRSDIIGGNPDESLLNKFKRWAKLPDDIPGEELKKAIDEKGNEFLKIRNASADRQLKKDIISAGYSYTPTYGGYKSDDGITDNYEPSYIVYNKFKGGQAGDFKDLEDFAVQMCKKYSQNSVYVQRPGEPPVYLDENGDQVNVSSTDKVKINRDEEEYFTTANRDKNTHRRFTSDIVFESMYINFKPASLSERRHRTSQGEVIL